MKTQTVNIIQAVNILKHFQGFQFCTMKTSKVCPLTKKDRGTKESTAGIEVIETAEYTGIGLGYEYEKSVNNRKAKEGQEKDFKAESLPFGEYIKGSKTIILYKGTHYLRIAYMEKAKCKKAYTLNGENSTYEKCASILKTLRKEKEGSSRQGVENTVKVISVKLCNITELNFDKLKLRIEA